MHIGAGLDGGIFLLPLDSTLTPRRLSSLNNLPEDASLYYSPIYSPSLEMIGYTTSYMVYVMSQSDRQAKRVFFNEGGSTIGNICFYKDQPKILFSIHGGFNLHSINIDGTNHQTIPIKIE